MYSPHTATDRSARDRSVLDRFADGSVETATGPKIVVMCFDRLDRDLGGALDAIAAGDHFETNRLLAHAQDLLGEVAGMLDLAAWEHAGALVSVYDYAMRRLVEGNATKSAATVTEVRRLLGEIGGAFREASVASLPSTAPVVATDDVRPRLSIQA